MPVTKVWIATFSRVSSVTRCRVPALHSGSGRRHTALIHVDDDFVAAQERRLEQRVEASEARRTDHRETLGLDRLEQAAAVAFVGGLRPATGVSRDGFQA